ncbi:uncharacterized protein FTJAE_9556 [Fusarium tjaetaba]|uniref:Uncharacterized protein n=1 Tax=Fusarium tjaetaba TaxID=1567544 RepID=A0A8H5R526_9HYPO|nr:uncharacterized protein FTJAE_9556 [Fusarium tjaetaba]KAF5626699.1 hypothetical protein FTJAE_9556 [Fusarium tjaetaba]
MSTPNLPNRRRPQPMSLGQFDAALHQVCQLYSGISFPQRSYTKARVLGVYFEGDKDANPSIGSASDNICDIFGKIYGYDAVSFMIKDTESDPEACLASALKELVTDMNENCLAVIHCIGQGKPLPNHSHGSDELHLARSQSDIIRKSPLPDPTVNFDRLRYKILDPSPSNVLIILDCCHAALSRMGERHDLIAAGSFGDVDAHCVPHEFTDNIVHHLEKAHNQTQILSAFDIYDRLATRHFVIKNGTPDVADMPVFHHDSQYRPIALLPMRPADIHSWLPAPTQELRLRMVNVIFSVNLSNTDIQTMGSMQGWNGGRRDRASSHIRVDQFYKSSSSIIVILAATFTIWYNLPQDPAIRFIGFEYNEGAASTDFWAQG